ncbi:hypothetical protein BOX15_Mlig013385g1 [Macrostomum lignano]|uniref:MFS domain-containing protein n=1 Tax=Macrostomum lignano TaxID=282301 RepID=A0A267F7L5_9PLAT|nr:hypothetical protein BOX15_Mlig013385g1 [Macrostomum lignano]
MTISSKAQELIDSVTPLLILVVCCISSLLIATNVRCHGSLALYLYEDLPAYVERNEVHWLGATHGMIVFMFVPLISGIIDHFKISYRTCMVASGLTSLLACLLSTGFSEPGYMIFTDTVAAGGAASVMLSTVILVIDDYFPRESSLRIFATTMVQGVAFATFFLIDGYSIALKLAGWRAVFYAYGTIACVMGIFGGLLFARPVRPYSFQQQQQQQQQQQSQKKKPLQQLEYSPLPSSVQLADARTDEADDDTEEAELDTDEEEAASASAPKPSNDASVIDQLFEKKDWKKRLLSMSLTEMQSSRTSLLWLCERLLAAVVSDGVFLFLLLHSGIARFPFIAGAATPSPPWVGSPPRFCSPSAQPHRIWAAEFSAV